MLLIHMYVIKQNDDWQLWQQHNHPTERSNPDISTQLSPEKRADVQN
jgi:hypothetical protein